MAEAPTNSVHPLSRSEWRAWLARHHTRIEGIWLISYKKGVGKPRVEYEEAVEEALCFGWIDSRPAKLDAERTMLWYTPRRPGSVWAKTNRARVEKLIAAGLMTPAGLARIEAAKRDGTWSKLEESDALTVPADLEVAFTQHPPAAQFFAAFPPSTRRGIFEWINSARRVETRAKRVAETARLAARNIRANQWTPGTKTRSNSTRKKLKK